MVSGVETGLIIRVNSAFAGAALGRRDDAGNPLNAIGTTPAEGAGSGALDGALPPAGIRPFGNGEPEYGEDEGPFFASGLNGLLAPPSIAAIQEQNGGSGETEAAREADNGIAQPSAPANDGDPAPASANEEEETGPGELTEEEEQLVEDLKQRDAEVRRHEQAHKAVGGQYAGAISYTYQSGPDGRRYAVGGEVPIDASPIAGDPEATIRKLEQVRRAALAPAEPSGADRAVAAQASQGIQQARAEQARESAEELEELVEGGDGSETSPEGAKAPVVPNAGAGEAEPAAATASPFAAEGDAAERSGASPFSVAANRGDEFDAGAFEIVRPDQRDSDSGTGIETSGQSPFDFTPFSGRVTLDISI
ncbi:putative metalloprotease CJM1_0395 family protein [Nisaea sp.]|uniref:putative metalloprotease CJM1_0395 family protein n=1 Tax=Nisaea sp. TaxID=2024842 RepID=UPI003B5202BE